MEENRDILDDEIRIIGMTIAPTDDDADAKKRSKLRKYAIWAVVAVLVVVGIVLSVVMRPETSTPKASTPKQIVEPSLFEPNTNIGDNTPIVEEEKPLLGRAVAASEEGFCEMLDMTVNDIDLRIYIPHNAMMTLHIGAMNKKDDSVVYVAQAADVRADNGGIVGAFVLGGEPKAWGLSKSGYAAVINNRVSVGVADNSPLFEEAVNSGGYFFRQYPLVKDGVMVENSPKGKSVRRAMCDRAGQIIFVESQTPESFHDFAQALEDIGCDQAIYLVGGSSYGWAVDQAGNRHEFGKDNYYTGRLRMPKNISYLVWRKLSREDGVVFTNSEVVEKSAEKEIVE